MRPRVILGPFDLRETRQGRWSSPDPRTGGGPLRNFFDEDFFQWLRSQIVIVDDNAYEGIDSTSDLDFMLPPGMNWGLKVRLILMVLRHFCTFECICNVF